MAFLSSGLTECKSKIRREYYVPLSRSRRESMLCACVTLLLMQQRRPCNNSKDSEMFIFPLLTSLILRLRFKACGACNDVVRADVTIIFVRIVTDFVLEVSNFRLRNTDTQFSCERGQCSIIWKCDDVNSNLGMILKNLTQFIFPEK
jgi:hypothetical protein